MCWFIRTKNQIQLHYYKKIGHWRMTLIRRELRGMMTSSNGTNFRVTGLLRWEFTGHRWIPHTKASDAELWCFLWSALVNGWVNNHDARNLRRHRHHCDVIVMEDRYGTISVFPIWQEWKTGVLKPFVHGMGALSYHGCIFLVDWIRKYNVHKSFITINDSHFLHILN